jgi:hypothetical protein
MKEHSAVGQQSWIKPFVSASVGFLYFQEDIGVKVLHQPKQLSHEITVINVPSCYAHTVRRRIWKRTTEEPVFSKEQE